MQSINQHNKPLAEATTGSIEALQQFSLAVQRHLQSKPEEAMQHYEAALRIDPDFTSAKVALAILNLDWAHVLPEVDPERGRALLDEAVTEVDTLTESERLQTLAHHAQFVEGNLEKAAELFNTQLSVFPDRPQIRHNLAIIYQRLGQPEAARTEFEKAIAIDPNMVVAYNGLLWLLREEFGDVDAIIEWSRRELEIAPDQVWPHLNLCFGYIGKGDGPRAVAAAEQAIEVAPDFVWTHYHLAHALKSAGDFADAARVYDRVYDRDPEQTWALYHAGHAYQRAGDPDTARARFQTFADTTEQLIADGEEYAYYPIWLDYVRIRLGDAPRATFSADELASAEPLFIWYLGQRYALMDRPDEAIDLLELALGKGLKNPIWAFAIPNFDPIRNNLRFQELKRSTLGLEES
jgi:tetratricopeptide (TPR) repeat protein